MRPMDFDLYSESAVRQKAGKRVNPGFVIRFSMKGRKFVAEISAGSNDLVSVYREDTQVIVLSLNASLGYAGIQILKTEGAQQSVFAKDCLEAIDTDEGVFFQSEETVREVLGPKGLDLSEATIVRRLFDCASSRH